MAGTDNRQYVKYTMVGLLALLTIPSAALAESKFLSLGSGYLLLVCALQFCRYFGLHHVMTAGLYRHWHSAGLAIFPLPRASEISSRLQI